MRVPATMACILFTLFLSMPAHSGDDVDLIGYMGTMQYMSHKTALAIDAENQALAAFYVHEMEEVIEVLETVESFDGHAIGALVKSILLPAFEQLEAAVKSGDWRRASDRFDRLVAGCNTCHETTQHAYIRIQRSGTNPYLQDFRAP